MNSPLLSSFQAVPGTHTTSDGQYTTGTSRKIANSGTLWPSGRWQEQYLTRDYLTHP